MSYRLQKKALLDVSATALGKAASARLLTQLSALTDQALGKLWAKEALALALVGDGEDREDREDRDAASSSPALIAVGGFGRGALFPYSDVDVLILMPQGPSPLMQTRVEAFIQSCWDAGLEIAPSVRTVGECMDEAFERKGGDITIQTALLESRFLCGDARLARDLQERFAAHLEVDRFITAKTLEMQQRHDQFENTPYALQPHCKEAKGGLRDLQMLLWLMKAAGLGGSWDELVTKNVITAWEAQQLKKNERFLSLVRIQLHLVAGRREDRLVFDLQNEVAQRFGFVSDSKRTNAEALMRRYYWAAKAVVQLHQIVLCNLQALWRPHAVVRMAIDEQFSNAAGLLDINHDDLFEREPHTILRAFWCFQTQTQINGLTARTLRALYNARARMDGAFRADPRNRATFVALFQHGTGLTHTLRLMNQTSVLGRYLWAFRRIVGQMQHDLFHVYTVDQHILMVLRNMRRFFVAEHAHEYPFCAQLAAHWDQPWVLYVAALFHDIAKGRGGDHSVLGAAVAKRFCAAHGIAKDETALIVFLVREHLTMSQVAQRQDLSNPEVIEKFAARVGSQRHLTALYLLTVADIRGTSPKVWNAWKAQLLEDLFRLTSRALGGQLSDARSLVQTTQREASALLRAQGCPEPACEALWQTLDVRYFMRQAVSDVVWHTQGLHAKVGQKEPLVLARRSPVGEGLQVLVYTPDAPDLFARICGYFDRHHFSIWEAKIHNTRNADGSSHALDAFVVTHPDMAQQDQDQGEAQSQDESVFMAMRQKVQTTLAQALCTVTADGTSPALSQAASQRRRRSSRVRTFPLAPQVELYPDEGAHQWILNLCASDRVGFLYAVAQVLSRHHVSVQLAKITTLGERVEDSFVLAGPALQDAKTVLAIKQEVLLVLGDFG